MNNSSDNHSSIKEVIKTKKNKVKPTHQKQLYKKSYSVLYNYLTNPTMITINLNKVVDDEILIISFIRKVIQRYYRIKYGRKWFKKSDKQKIGYCIEQATYTHIHLLIDNLTQSDYHLFEKLVKLQEIEDTKHIKIKPKSYDFKIEPYELTVNKLSKLSDNYIEKFDDMSEEEQSIHCDDLLGINRALYINEDKAQRLINQTKVKVFNYPMKFIHLLDIKIDKPELSATFKNLKQLETDFSNLKSYLLLKPFGASCESYDLERIQQIVIQQYDKWLTIAQQSFIPDEKKHFNKMIDKLMKELDYITSSNQSLNKQKKLPLIMKLCKKRIKELKSSYKHMLKMKYAYQAFRDFLINNIEIPTVKDIVSRIKVLENQKVLSNYNKIKNYYNKKHYIAEIITDEDYIDTSYKMQKELIDKNQIADDDFRNWFMQAKDLFCAELTSDKKQAAISYIVKTCGNSCVDNNFPIYTDETIFYPTKNDK